MKYMGRCWKCDTCGGVNNATPWDCVVCGKEVCELCFDMYMTCRECTVGRTERELKLLADEVYGTSFAEDDDLTTVDRATLPPVEKIT